MAEGSSLEDGDLYQLEDYTTVAVGDSLYLWCGAQEGLPRVHDDPEKRRMTSKIQIFPLSSGKWTTHVTKGTPPLGVMAYACCAVTDKLYYFGGFCGHESCDHNSINQLDTSSLTWTELEPTDSDRPVMRRGCGGMIPIKCDGVHHLLMIGGVGLARSPPTTQLPQADYIETPNGGWRTNEHSLYNISTGEWSNPSITGDCIPPISHFAIESINDSRAIVFGGEGINNEVYLMEISGHTVDWQKLKKPDSIDQWPDWRCLHGAAAITGAVSPVLVIMGGDDWARYRCEVLNDCWLFDITSRVWTEITLPNHVCERKLHSLSAFVMGPHRIWIVIVGGKNVLGRHITAPNNTMLIELVCTDGKWSVEDILDSRALSTKMYQQKYLQQVQSRREGGFPSTVGGE